MEALAELQKLSLISILCKELENHHIPADQDLAEFLIELTKESKYNPTALYNKLMELDPQCGFTVAFCENLVEIIQKMLNPNSNQNTTTSSSSSKTNKTKEYSNPSPPRNSDKYENSRNRSHSSDRSKSTHKHRHHHHHHHHHHHNDSDSENEIKRNKSRSRSRSRSRNKGENNNYYNKNDRSDLYNPTAPKRNYNEYNNNNNKSYSTNNNNNNNNKSMSKSKPKKKLTDYELFEYKQLIAAGAMKVEDLPDYDPDEGGLALEVPEEETEFDVQLNDAEPVFLSGQTSKSVELSPIRIVKNPDGTLQRAATNQSALAKKRKQLREAQKARKEGKEVLDDEDEEMMTADQVFRAPVRKYIPQLQKKKSIEESRKDLPIYKLKEAFIEAVKTNQILVVIGETGSGKTTQMTQYLHDAGFTSHGCIGCTQPRRVAATSVAKRVSEEFGCKLGKEVGYTIRFDDRSCKETIIKYMTDGMLLREYLMDHDLKRYSVIILDEAHERTINTDVLFSLVKQLSKRRKELRIIVTSATLDANKFSIYFDKCAIFTIPGRTFHVDISYVEEPVEDYLTASINTVFRIHTSEPAGDILLFLTGKEEIDTACEILDKRMKEFKDELPELIIIPIYAALPPELQEQVFQPTPKGKRKCVIATNIAEASLTIDGIYYVIDPGFCKQKAYNPKTGMDSLIPVPISQASAKQRAGRAGRTGPGKCFRLYTESAFKNEMLPNTIPEIQRANLGTVALQLKAMGIHDIINFEFMDPPPRQTLISALQHLWELNALDKDGFITPLGRQMAQFPLDPSLSKVLIKSAEEGCSDEILTIVSLLAGENVFYRPRDKQEQADNCHKQFMMPEGDHFTLLCVYREWEKNGESSQWCSKNYLNARHLQRAKETRKQLMKILDQYHLDVISCKDNSKIQECLVGGYFKNVGKRNSSHDGYERLTDKAPIYIHPSSSLFQRAPEWVLYHEITLTSREYMKNIMEIKPQWLVKQAPNFYKQCSEEELKRRRKELRLEPLYDKFHAADSWRLSRRKG